METEFKKETIQSFESWKEKEGVANKVFRKMRDEIISLWRCRCHAKFECKLNQGDWKEWSATFLDPIDEIGFSIKEMVEEQGPNIEFLEMTERPFGFIYSVNGIRYQIMMKRKGNGGEYTYHKLDTV